MRSQGHHSFAPFGKNLRSATSIGATQNRAAEMVQDDGRLREVRGQRRYLVQLGMVNPGIESETEPGQILKALAELLLREYPRTWHGFVHAFIRVPRRRKADCAQAPAASGQMCLQNRRDA